MLGNHDGIPPPHNIDEVSKEALRVFGRLKVGKDVAFRQRSIAKALSSAEMDTPYWHESLASNLAAQEGVDAIPAHLASLAACWKVQETETAKLLRDVNAAGDDDFSGRATMTLLSAAPELKDRIMSGKINSDEVYLRVALTHLFRRDPDSSFAMFIIDGVVRQLPKAMKIDVTTFCKNALERFDETPAPEGAWGYVVVLRNLSARSGYYLYPATDEQRKNLKAMIARLEQVMGDLSDEAILHHLSAAIVSGYLLKGDFGTFAGIMSALLDQYGKRFVVLYAGEDDGGMRTQIHPIPASTPEEARRLVSKMPEVQMHDDFRALTEYLAQQDDLKDTVKD
jgi:hypothetical protein